MAARSADYADLGQIERLESMAGDVAAIMQHTPSIMVGTPDELIARIKQLESLGFNEIAMRIDGFGHTQNMKAIELIGKYVIPEFRSPRSIVGSPQTPHVYTEMGVQDVPRYAT